MQHLEPECLSLSLHLAQGARPPAADATPLRLSRALEHRVADVEGPADVRHWLQLIGHGEEHEWIDLGTVGGGVASDEAVAGCRWHACAAGHVSRPTGESCSPHAHHPISLLPTCPQVKGYRRVLFCQSVRDDVAGALGHGAWTQLLPRMCEGRLVPTPWLNKVGAGWLLILVHVMGGGGSCSSSSDSESAAHHLCT